MYNDCCQSDSTQMDFECLISVIQHCEAMCEHMVTYVACQRDVVRRTRQLQLLRDCADICALTAKYIARDSMFAKHTAELCACICDACARECAKFPDAQSQHCAQVCQHCARECMEFARR